MIPYDDLVVALATWRARQGLPVSSLSGALSPPMGFAQAAATPPPMRAPVAPPAAPPRPAAPPAPPVAVAPPPPPAAAAPPPAFSTAAVPPPLAPPPEDSLDGDLLEAEGAYENEGDDFAVAFGANAGAAAAATAEAEATAIGGAPRPSSDGFGGLTEPGRATHAGQSGDTGEHTIAGGGEPDPDRHNW